MANKTLKETIKYKKILITGAAGFIGSSLFEALQLDNIIFPVDNFSLGKYKKNIWNCDVANKQFLAWKINDLDYIFHFGSPCSIIQFNKAPKMTRNNTIRGFRNILKISCKSGAKLVYPSTGNIYGDLPIPNKELNVKPSNFYAQTKHECELMAKKYFEKYDVNSIGLRIFAGYGLGEKHKDKLASAVTLFLNAIFEGKNPVVWGDGTQSRDFIYIDDIVAGLLKAAKLSLSYQIVNLGTGVSTSFNKLIQILCDELQVKVEPLYVKKPVLYVEKTEADVSLMKKLLKLEPSSLKEGIKKYMQEKNKHDKQKR